MRFACKGLLTSLLLAYTITAQCHVQNQDEKKPPEDLIKACTQKKLRLCVPQSRLQAYNPNHTIYQYTTQDDMALEINYSFRYLISKPDCFLESDAKKKTCIETWDKRTEWYFTLTGQFDFYVHMGGLGRTSGPVVNRISNPGAHVRKYYSKTESPIWFEWVSLGYEHRSNGQTTDLDNQADHDLAAQKWQQKDYAYIDGIGRGADYLIVEAKKSFESGFKTWISAKVPIREDSYAKWQNLEHHIWDYDLVRLIVSYNKKRPEATFFKYIEATLEYTFGKKLLSTDSANATFYFPMVFGNRKFNPLNFIKLHAGPMNTLANYTEPQYSIGVGMKFNPFPKGF